MKYDKPLLAVLIGMAVMFPLELYSQIFKYLDLTKVSTFEFTSLISENKPSWWVGLLAGPGIGGLAVLFIYYSPKWFGKDYLPLKAAFSGLVTYGLIDVIMVHMATKTQFKLSSLEHYVHASSGALGGLMAGFLLNRFVFKNNKKKENGIKKYTLVSEPLRKRDPKKKRHIW